MAAAGGAGEPGTVNVTIGTPDRSGHVARAPGKIVGQIVELTSPVVQDMPYGMEDIVTKYVIIGDITEVPKTGIHGVPGTMGDLLLKHSRSGKLVQGGGRRKSRKNKKHARRSRRNN